MMRRSKSGCGKSWTSGSETFTLIDLGEVYVCLFTECVESWAGEGENTDFLLDLLFLYHWCSHNLKESYSSKNVHHIF